MRLGILLTAAIDVNNMILLKVSQSDVRRKQYREAFVKWLHLKDDSVKSITFVENSNADLSDFAGLIQRENRFGREVELISLNLNDYPRELGKGYGEFLMVDRAMEQSRFLSSVDLVAKVTGRLFVRNFARIAARLPDGLDVAGDLGHRPVAFLDTRLFFVTPTTYQDWFAGVYLRMNDSTGDIAETVLGRVVCGAPSLKVLKILPSQPLWDGISGTHGISYDGALQRLKYPYHLLRRLFRRTLRRSIR